MNPKLDRKMFNNQFSMFNDQMHLDQFSVGLIGNKFQSIVSNLVSILTKSHQEVPEHLLPVLRFQFVGTFSIIEIVLMALYSMK